MFYIKAERNEEVKLYAFSISALDGGESPASHFHNINPVKASSAATV
jgi:hypothetical protein